MTIKKFLTTAAIAGVALAGFAATPAAAQSRDHYGYGQTYGYGQSYRDNNRGRYERARAYRWHHRHDRHDRHDRQRGYANGYYDRGDYDRDGRRDGYRDDGRRYESNGYQGGYDGYRR
jgi:hypothetical protein